jgi:endonuclease/exonuclease/phosphatase family metal-dependent hydrolase
MLKKNCIILCATLLISSFAFAESPKELDDNLKRPEGTIRLAQFNIRELSTEKIKDVNDAGAGQHSQLKAAAEIIQLVDADVLVLNEIDHDYTEAGLPLEINARRFNDAYLNQGDDAITYEFAYAAPCNTGILAGHDFDKNDKIATAEDENTRNHGGDCYGFGEYPGQYSMAILSRYPLVADEARTFQKFLWRDLPGSLAPNDYYTTDMLNAFRLSSKSHWDVPLELPTGRVNLWVCHPTPRGFDGEDDRNGKRNFDEIRFWVEYLDKGDKLIDDNNKIGGYESDDPFVIIGDLNSTPYTDASIYLGQPAIRLLLDHPQIIDTGELMTSEGGPAEGTREPGWPKYLERNTIKWGGGSRIDYILPSDDLEPVNGGVFWPNGWWDPQGYELVEEASDHRMIWLDIEPPAPKEKKTKDDSVTKAKAEYQQIQL